MWSAVVLPPAVVAWDGRNAPAWALQLAGGRPYSWMRAIGNDLGAPGDYVLFGVLVAPAFLLIGVSLLSRARIAGRWTAVLAWLTLLGAPVVTLSYVAYSLPPPWHAMWGMEIPLLVAMGICGVVAGVAAYVCHRLPLWWSALLAATIGVLTVSTVLFTYFPHGSLIGFGLEVAILAFFEPTLRSDRADGATP